MIEGIRDSFWIGYRFNGNSRGNMKSKQDNLQVTHDYLTIELQVGRIVGLLDRKQFPYANWGYPKEYTREMEADYQPFFS